MLKALQRLLAVLLLSLVAFAGRAQSDTGSTRQKPYKVVNNGRQLSIQSKQNLKQVMLWTTGGNRLVEHRDIKDNAISFTIPVNGNLFFLMVGMENGKVYTEKIGIR